MFIADEDGLHMVDDEVEDPHLAGSVQLEGSAVKDMQIGDNFLVLAEPNNAENVSFYLARCIVPEHVLKTPRVDRWGSGSYALGDKVVAGKYYQQWRKNERSYVYLDTGEDCVVTVNAVLLVNVAMEVQSRKVKGSNLYRISEETLQMLQAIVSEHLETQDD